MTSVKTRSLFTLSFTFQKFFFYLLMFSNFTQFKLKPVQKINKTSTYIEHCRKEFEYKSLVRPFANVFFHNKLCDNARQPKSFSVSFESRKNKLKNTHKWPVMHPMTFFIIETKNRQKLKSKNKCLSFPFTVLSVIYRKTTGQVFF